MLCKWFSAGVAVTHSITAPDSATQNLGWHLCQPPLAGAGALHQPISPHIIASHSLSLLLTHHHALSLGELRSPFY